MIKSAALLKDLKAQLKLAQADLRARADDQVDRWGARLQEEYAEARRRERTGHSWVVWRDNEVDQAAVAWLIATTFVRFCEDNDLLSGARIDGQPVPVGWIAGPGDRTARAEENLTAYFRDNPTHNRRDWLRQAFRVLAAQLAGEALVDKKHNPVWIADISAERASALIDFWRATNSAGELVHDFSDASLDTRFLGDLYQDLSEHARKTYALLQTPVFVEEFILDQTLTPALAEFGLDGIKLIDPTCGSGHFLLGAFERLVEQWQTEAPALDAKERVRRAMSSIHGVDLNPFAVAISRFRLTVAGLLAMEERSLVGVPNLGFHLAIGDSLLGEFGGAPEALQFEGEEVETYLYDGEDLKEYAGILKHGQYHIVVGNPPYITVKDPALNALYKSVYPTAYKEYQLTAPFMELLFRLAIRGEHGQAAGYVGQITGNGFMKQEFGRKVVEDLFGGFHTTNPVDLLKVINTEGAYIPGHGTPTVILIGRRRRPVGNTVRTIVSLRNEPSEPANPARGLVWTEITEHHLDAEFVGAFIGVVETSRSVFATFPWQISDNVRASIQEQLEASTDCRLKDVVDVFGYTGQTNADGAFLASAEALARRGVETDLCHDFVTGEDVRDYGARPGKSAIFPYRRGKLVSIDATPGLRKWLWPVRSSTWARATFSKKTYKAEGRTWWEWHQVSADRIGTWALTYPRVATLQHFALVRASPVFNREASFLQLPAHTSEETYLGLLALLNSSSATFWLKQVSHNKGRPSADGAGADEPWEHRYEFTGTKLERFPLPAQFEAHRGRELDDLGQRLSSATPTNVVRRWVTSPGNDLNGVLSEAKRIWNRTREEMIFAQEELDWDTYRRYGLIDVDLTFNGDSPSLTPSHRAFAMRLAREVREGTSDTSWFDHWNHRFEPIVEVPSGWPTEYSELIQARLDLIESNATIRALEQPEYKRRWAGTTWEKQVLVALQDAILDRLELASLWRDGQGPVSRSVAEIADALKSNVVLRELVTVLTGDSEADLTKVLASLVTDQAVPYVAAHRYKGAGLEKFRTWQNVWDLQRREDSGEKVDISVPKKYSTPDFRKVEYWKARGKLDVPKERFILYPDLGREGDSTVVLGWAGWDHKDQALALAREFPTQDALGAGDELLTQMVAGLVELEPWVRQWHSAMDASFGVSPADAISGIIDQQLGRLEATREQVTAWEPPAPPRGRRAKNS